MDAFSRSLAAAALVDGQHFTLPGFGTIEGVYISARIDHGARRVEAPRLEVRWQSEEDPSAQTFAELLVGTGATSFEANDIQDNWLDALSTGESIQLGDLGSLIPDTVEGICSFKANDDALASTFSGSRTVPLEPISKRALPNTPVAPVVAIETQKQIPASAKTNASIIRKMVPYVSAAAIVLFGVMAINYFSKSPSIDESRGKAVTVNQDRLNRSPREEATTADLPLERIEEASPSDILAGEPDLIRDPEPRSLEPEEVFSEEIIADVIPDNNEPDPASEYSASPIEEVTTSKAIPSFDPAALAGGLDDDTMFEISEIDVVIVLGSFGNANNAARLTEEVAAAGLIPYVDQPGELTRVGATFSVSSEAEIEEIKQRMRKQFNPSAWVLE